MLLDSSQLRNCVYKHPNPMWCSPKSAAGLRRVPVVMATVAEYLPICYLRMCYVSGLKCGGE